MREWEHHAACPTPSRSYARSGRLTSSSAGLRRGRRSCRSPSPGSCASRPSSSRVASTRRTCRRLATATSRRRGIARQLSRWIIRRASRVVTYSNYLLGELDRNVGVPPIASPSSTSASRTRSAPSRMSRRERLALTVGHVASLDFERKGRAFVEASRFLPTFSSTLAGAWVDGSVERLRELAGPNVTFTGGLPREEPRRPLPARVRLRPGVPSTRASVWRSRRGCLAGCIPVVTRAGALPEVVGDVGVQVETNDPETLAEGISRALDLEDDVRRRARARVLEEFPLDARARGLRPSRGGVLARSWERAARGRPT